MGVKFKDRDGWWISEEPEVIDAHRNLLAAETMDQADYWMSTLLHLLDADVVCLETTEQA